MDRLLEALDSIFFSFRGVKVGSLELYEKIIPGIVQKLKECGCEVYAIRNYVDFDEVKLVFSCGKNCVIIEFNVEPVSLNHEKVRRLPCHRG